MVGKLEDPVERSWRQSAIENAELMIEESIADIIAIQAGGSAKKPHHLGPDYDEGYAQGRKDACRVILISLGQLELGLTSDEVRDGR